ncbi:Energy-coupling factor transporter transmembrane protein EcfT [Methanosarcinaceae archaeon Ag5]|uniref:Energy-coupling factor transporter transmembrane protein EcfT n=1 Tax=Methanolapillus africanus TaxID=3028297 RepID=A0AAE4MK80_9EURY|nr:Energy-coupling factor transporter transmembrane protein EcfT [Methanosarcinaceae archaeon Ag5]
MVTNLDDIALLSPLRYKNTSLKLFLVIFGLLTGLLSDTPLLPLFIAVCMIAATIIFGKIPVKFYFKLFAALLGFALISCIILLFFSTGEDSPVLWSIDILWWTFSITTASLNQAVLVFSRTINGLACIFFLSMTTPMLEMFSYFKRVSFLDVFIELAMLIYRYIFVFLETAINIQSSQKMRFGYKGFKNSIRSLGMLVGTLFVQTLEQGDKLYLSMNSRCYTGKLPFYTQKYKIKATDAVLSVLFIGATIVVFIYTRGYQFF